MIYAEASLNKSDVILENEVAKFTENEVAKIMSSPMNLLMITTLNFCTNSSYTRLTLLLSFQCQLKCNSQEYSSLVIDIFGCELPSDTLCPGDY